MYKKEEVRELLHGSAQSKFDDIVLSRVLGANAHTRLIGEIMMEIAQQETQVCDIIQKVMIIAEFFKETRGQNSRAIYNAIATYTRGFAQLGNRPREEVVSVICDQIQHYDQTAKAHMQTLVSYGVHLCEQMDTMMIFDYSSTVDAFVQALPSGMQIYIPESRALDGGRPFVKHAVEAGHHVHFIPDTTMLSALANCQAAFMGAETFYPDGTVFNTIGSDILAVLCDYLKKPLYVLTPMIKVDVRPVQGYVRLSAMPFDYGNRLAGDWDFALREKVDFLGFKLLEVKPKLITAYITERGILTSGALFQESMQYAKELEVAS